MPSPQPAVRLGPRGLCLGASSEAGAASDDGSDLPLFAGAVEAYRLPPAAWDACLEGIAGLGCQLLELRVPWSVHERGTGELDLRGARPHPRGWSRDLLGFLRACARHGLKVILAPGPLSARGVSAGGLPERLLVDAALGARGPRGEALWVAQPPRSFVQPSLASARFREAACGWLSGLAQAVAPFVYPAGPLVAVRLMMQPGVHGRRGIFDADYHPEAVAHYREFLEERYLDGLPAAYGAGAQLANLEPPRRVAPTSALPALDWLRCKAALERAALEQATAALGEDLGRLPLLTAQPLGAADGWGAALAERGVAAAGLVLGQLRTQAALERRAFERLVGASRLPHVAELPWGSSFFWGPPEPAVQEQRALRALMTGARGFVLEALLAHDERVGAPLGLDGRPGEARVHEATRRLFALAQGLRLHACERKVKVGLLEPFAERGEVLSRGLLGPAIPSLLALFGLEVDALAEPREAVDPEHVDPEQVVAALDASRVAYERVTDEVGAAALQRYAALVLPRPTLRPSDELLARLTAYVARGGQLLVVGPVTSSTGSGEADAPWPTHVVVDVADLRARLAALGLATTTVQAVAADGELLPCELRCPQTGDGALFVENPRATPTAVELRGVAAQLLWDASRGVPLRDARIELAAGEVRVLRCRARDGEPAGGAGGGAGGAEARS